MKRRPVIKSEYAIGGRDEAVRLQKASSVKGEIFNAAIDDQVGGNRGVILLMKRLLEKTDCQDTTFDRSHWRRIQVARWPAERCW